MRTVNSYWPLFLIGGDLVSDTAPLTANENMTSYGPLISDWTTHGCHTVNKADKLEFRSRHLFE